MKQANRTTGTLVLVSCLGIGAVSLGTGSWTLANLSQTYRPDDVLFSEGPNLFRSWLTRRMASNALRSEAIGQRLLMMPIASRRATAVAMMDLSFYEGLWTRERDRVPVLKMLEEGILAALSTAPSAGELWLAATKTRALHTGFDKKAESFLATSYLMAPREADIARARMVFVDSVSRLLRRSYDEARARDEATVEIAYPAFDRAYRGWIASRQPEKINRMLRQGLRK